MPDDENVQETKEEEIAPVAPPPPAPALSPLSRDEIVARLDEWFRNNVPGSAIARSTEAWNHLYETFDALKTSFRRS